MKYLIPDPPPGNYGGQEAEPIREGEVNNGDNGGDDDEHKLTPEQQKAEDEYQEAKKKEKERLEKLDAEARAPGLTLPTPGGWGANEKKEEKKGTGPVTMTKESVLGKVPPGTAGVEKGPGKPGHSPNEAGKPSLPKPGK